MKFHAIAIAIISVIIIVLYMLIGPTGQERGPAKPTDRFVRVSNATWGLACNAMIDEARRASQDVPLAKDADGKVIHADPIKKVTTDNVLPRVKSACEGQLGCEVLATDDSLGVALLPGCYKQLNVNYRCSDMDRLVTVNIDQGQSLRIDCMAANASTPSAQHP